MKGKRQQAKGKSMNCNLITPASCLLPSASLINLPTHHEDLV